MLEGLDYKYDFRDKRNLSLVMDFYELTMSQCYFNSEHRNRIVTFDMFYRRNPDQGGYALFAGLEELIGYIQNLHFVDEDIEYLRSLNKFSEEHTFEKLDTQQIDKIVNLINALEKANNLRVIK